MKKLLLILLPIFFLMACKTEQKSALAVQLDTVHSDVVEKDAAGEKIYEAKIGTDIYYRYFLVPESNETLIVEDVFSTEPEILEITSVDKGARFITTKAKKEGTAYIRVTAQNHNTNSSPKTVILK